MWGFISAPDFTHQKASLIGRAIIVLSGYPFMKKQLKTALEEIENRIIEPLELSNTFLLAIKALPTKHAHGIFPTRRSK